MKIKNKILSFVLALCLIIPCALVFTACDKDDKDKPTFAVGQNVLTVANDIVSDLTKIYKSGNVPANQTFTLTEMKDAMASLPIPEDVKNFNYYVEIGEVDDIDDVNSITLASKFTKNQTFKLSLGNNAHLEAKVFFEDDDKIYVAAPVLVFETVNLGKIKINNNEFDFDLDVEVEASNFTNVEFQDGATSISSKVSDNEYNLNFKEANRYIKLSYADATANDIVLTKKVIGNSINYGLTDLEGTVLGLYPIKYSSAALTQEYFDNYNGKTMEYSAYVLNSGVHSVKLNFSITLPSA
ncbi:MAG: hypothetical protein IJ458_03815 [Clostridia bacterium]|nr:hypothetical protein [Clostridia bacterium]